MTLPKWNDEWEKPDPLRGRRGWQRHHYATACVAAILFAVSLTLFFPAVVNARFKQHKLDREYEQFAEVLAQVR